MEPKALPSVETARRTAEIHQQLLAAGIPLSDHLSPTRSELATG
jgi:hypothetical protein